MKNRHQPEINVKRQIKFFATAAALALACAGPASAHRGAASEASFLSTLPIAVSVAVPVAVLASGAALTVVAVEAVSEGAVWVLERVSDGARFSVTLSAAAAGGVSVFAGTAVVAVACSTGWVLSTAGRAIAFIPNEIGKALLYNERVTR
jgi:cytochrome c oxidase assembly factor CtaG